MKLRKGGRISSSVSFQYGGHPIRIVNRYEYLGITVQPLLTFTDHLQRKKLKSVAAIGTIRRLQTVSLKTAITLFKIKVQPVLEYGLHEIAPFLTPPQLLTLDSIKATFLKRALCVHISTSNTLVFRMCDESSMVEELARNHPIKRTSLEIYEAQRREKIARLEEDGFSNGPAFHNTTWKKEKQKFRHIVTRTTVHGFHFRICQNEAYHSPNDSCVCKLCNMAASDRYHIMTCTGRHVSLNQFVNYF